MLSPRELIQGQRENRQTKQVSRAEAEDSRSQFYGVVAGYDGATGQWLVRIRGGLAEPARVLKPTTFEVGEVVSTSRNSGGTLWMDKL